MHLYTIIQVQVVMGVFNRSIEIPQCMTNMQVTISQTPTVTYLKLVWDQLKLMLQDKKSK